MRLAILSDIHGNLPALEAVQADLAQFAVDQVVVAGDLINWGPFSVEVVERVLAEGWAVLRGNHEYYLLDYGTDRAPATWSDPERYALLPWLRRQIPTRLLARIATWPDTISVRPVDAPPLRIVHGAPESVWRALSPYASDESLLPLLAGVDEETIVAAHTHRAMDRRVGRWRLLNPGSVGLPLEGDHLASYLILESDAAGWHGIPRRVPFTNEALFAEFERQGFRETVGLVGQFVLDEFTLARPRIVPFLCWQQETCPEAPFTAATVAAFETVNPEDFMPAGYRRPVVARG